MNSKTSGRFDSNNPVKCGGGAFDMSTEVACMILGTIILFVTIYACAPAQGFPHLIKLGVNFISSACEITTVAYFLFKTNSDSNISNLP
jgi:hypothetical protein